MKKIRFTTMFPLIENIHLVKDVGMIPYSMKKYFNYDSSIVTYRNLEYKYFEKEVKLLKRLYFPFNKFKSILNCVFYLVLNSKKIDVLHLYHLGERTTLACVPTYLFFNKKGLIYLHMDENTNNDLTDLFKINGKGIKVFIKSLILKNIIYSKSNRKRILFGLQNKTGIDMIKGVFPFDNVEYISNGYEDVSDYNKKIKKENIILFVGRVGNKQKRTDILLNGFREAYPRLKNWKLRLVGPIEEDFKDYINEFNEKNPIISKSVEFVGPVYDRNELKKEYKKAKVFCLTSDYESFGLVTVEALANGCTIISSDIDISKEIIMKDKLGKLFKRGNVKDLANCMIEICSDEKKMKYVQENALKYVEENYSYKKTLIPLDNWIKDNIK